MQIVTVTHYTRGLARVLDDTHMHSRIALSSPLALLNLARLPGNTLDRLVLNTFGGNSNWNSNLGGAR